VIIITTQCFAPKIGGIESLMTGLAESISSLGKDVLVLADGKANLEEDKDKKYSIKRFEGWKPLRRIKKAKYLEKICKEKNIEVIYADSWKSIEYVNKKNKKIIVLAHGTEIPKQYWTIMIDTMRFKKNRIIRSYNDVYKIIANSNYTKDLMQASLKINRRKIEIIHPGIDVYRDFISNKEKSFVEKIVLNKSPVITTLARVEKRKGHIYIINAINTLRVKFPNLIYLIAGKGPYLNIIKGHVKKLNLNKHVEFLGWITEPEKSLILKNSDIFAMTPITSGESVEGFGMAFIDAAFHGVASIGSNNGGIVDAIIDGKTGIICEQANQSEITFNLQKLIENKELRDELGNNGKKIAKYKFSWKNKVHEYLNAAGL
jgi:phosphatidylinositol alpha-1,6-mannosyltransferase